MSASNSAQESESSPHWNSAQPPESNVRPETLGTHGITREETAKGGEPLRTDEEEWQERFANRQSGWSQKAFECGMLALICYFAFEIYVFFAFTTGSFLDRYPVLDLSPALKSLAELYEYLNDKPERVRAAENPRFVHLHVLLRVDTGCFGDSFCHHSGSKD
ncbi:MAG: hypothetical protein Q4A31_03150 [Corynebacterium sp.]|uniref:hypothetical protein n=1 Tax=Corynebacterium sp. TaxID=1720 RepID=UPI0026DD6DC5|nr:hypothetical protein [Corynebacterium sp.]MDO4760904.1 hypothetical protein [Corynebacterium sp.]